MRSCPSKTKPVYCQCPSYSHLPQTVSRNSHLVFAFLSERPPISQVMLWLPVQNPIHSLFSRMLMSSLRPVMTLGSMSQLLSLEVRVALAPMPATSTHSHAPTMSTHASHSATPSLVPKCISPGHAASMDHYPASSQGHNPSQPQSYIPGSPQPQGQKTVIRSTLASQSQPSAQLQQTQIIAVIIH